MHSHHVLTLLTLTTPHIYTPHRFKDSTAVNADQKMSNQHKYILHVKQQNKQHQKWKGQTEKKRENKKKKYIFIHNLLIVVKYFWNSKQLEHDNSKIPWAILIMLLLIIYWNRCAIQTNGMENPHYLVKNGKKNDKWINQQIEMANLHPFMDRRLLLPLTEVRFALQFPSLQLAISAPFHLLFFSPLRPIGCVSWKSFAIDKKKLQLFRNSFQFVQMRSRTFCHLIKSSNIYRP